MNANKKLIIMVLISLMCCLAIFTFFKSDRREMKEKAKLYLENNYMNTQFKYIETRYQIDGGIYELKFSKDDTGVEYSVFIVSNKIYDNYLRTDIENEKKETLYKLLEKDIEKKDLEIYLDSPFEDERKLKKYKAKIDELNYSVGLYHDENYDKKVIIEKYSKLAHIIFTNHSNISSIIVKNYDKKEVELYFFIEKQDLNSDFSVENIKYSLENQQMVHEK